MNYLRNILQKSYLKRYYRLYLVSKGGDYHMQQYEKPTSEKILILVAATAMEQ